MNSGTHSTPTLWRIATDTGGTFTDCHAIHPEGLESRCKVLSTGCLRAILSETQPFEGRTPQDSKLIKICLRGLPALPNSLLTGFHIYPVGSDDTRRIESFDVDSGDVSLSASVAWKIGILLELTTHEEAPVLGARILTNTPLGAAFPPMRLRIATTRATNALLERKGGRVALLITKGFKDLLQIGDQRRRDLFALQHEQRPLFHEITYEISGRFSATGEELETLDEKAIEAAAKACLKQGIHTAAISFLHGHEYPTHELRAAAILHNAGLNHLTLSHQTAAFAKLLPRTQSTVADAYLHEPVQSFLQGIRKVSSSMEVMTSSGGLRSCDAIRPKDMLLSGPAAGAIGAANAAQRVGYSKIITFDMGGTSTDVARMAGQPSYRFSQDVAGMRLLAPCINLETVAAGGGSICQVTHHGLSVGPESAGSNPGPACYGKGGPLTITDVNLLLGRFDPHKAPIPLDVAASRHRLQELHAQTDGSLSEAELLHALLRMAIEHMTDAIRRISIGEGYDPADHALLAFGGAGPQHACEVASSLGIRTILIPQDAGILSAVGLQEASPEEIEETEICLPLSTYLNSLQNAESKMGPISSETTIQRIAELRLKGQDIPLQVEFEDAEKLPQLYVEVYQRIFGYAPPAQREVEIVSIRVIRRTKNKNAAQGYDHGTPSPPAASTRLIQDAFSTLVIAAGWSEEHIPGFGYVLRDEGLPSVAPVPERDLLRHRFHSIVSDMGALLCRTAISTNIRERLDFSCALLNAKGQLLSSAPHIPVHLGALGVCVRQVRKAVPMREGDTIITNHPAYGGSHLPDVTLITPVFHEGELLGYVANRAHHAEIGGLTPGSMPAHGTCLIEEGVVIAPQHLIRAGRSCLHEISSLLTKAEFPTRNLDDNLADLHAQLAANLHGAARLRELRCEDLSKLMDEILNHSAGIMRSQIRRLPDLLHATERLDDGSVLKVNMKRRDDALTLDFTGTSGVHSHNLNATNAIVRSAILYVMRLLLQQDLPLNEGLMEPLEIILPECLLNPSFTGDAKRDPAVVGGNVEVSQRLVDTLIKALNLQACSQGTMNNFLFGGPGFGYYETIAGGSGAGKGYAGAHALHTHMTNTAITDPEIIEQRYPVRLRRFEIRHGSGGEGKWRGGDGVVREFEFTAPLTVSLLTQHRKECPYGLDGGQPGQSGSQRWIRQGKATPLESCVSFEVESGDRVILETPGGGGWGSLNQ